MPAGSYQISIIIPTLNEEGHIGKVLQAIATNATSGCVHEIIVVDGGSTDATTTKALNLGARVLKSPKGRAKQMNVGANNATGNILYFLHVDSMPPINFDKNIINTFKEGYLAGCFRLKFDSKSLFLGFFAWCTRINHIICRGGDQSLFIHESLFKTLNCFDERYTIYEDNELTHRIYKDTSFKIVADYVTTSARRYNERGMFALQLHFGVIHAKYFIGAKPSTLYAYYLKNIADKKAIPLQNQEAPLPKSI